MQGARRAVAAEAIPVEQPESGVAALLDFSKYDAAADGVDGSGRQEDAIPRLGRERVEALLQGSRCEVVFQVGTSDAGFQPGVDPAGGPHFQDDPGFSFAGGFTAETDGLFVGRMDLDGQQITAVKELDQQRKPIAGRDLVSEEIRGMGGTQVGEQGTAQRSFGHPADVERMSADLPRFADGNGGRKDLPQLFSQVSAPPDHGAQVRLENQWVHGMPVCW